MSSTRKNGKKTVFQGVTLTVNSQPLTFSRPGGRYFETKVDGVYLRTTAGMIKGILERGAEDFQVYAESVQENAFGQIFLHVREMREGDPKPSYTVGIENGTATFKEIIT